MEKGKNHQKEGGVLDELYQAVVKNSEHSSGALEALSKIAFGGNKNAQELVNKIDNIQPSDKPIATQQT